MRAATTIFILSCLLVSITYADTIQNNRTYEPSNSPFVRYDYLPEWFQNQIKASKYLNLSNLTLVNVLNAGASLVLENKDITNEEREFLLNPNIAYSEKSQKILNLGLYEHAYFKLSKANFTTNETLGALVRHYRNAYSFINRALREQRDLGNDLPFYLLFNDVLKHRRMPHKGMIYRGTLCNITKMNSTIGELFENDIFASFSEDFDVTLNHFSPKPKAGLKLCYIHLNLTNDDHCAADIKEFSRVWKEVVVPFATKFRLIDIVPEKAEKPSYYNTTWRCAEQTKDLYANSVKAQLTKESSANSIRHPQVKASSMFIDL